MTEFVLQSDHAEQLRASLFRDPEEACAILFTETVERASGTRVLGRELWIADAEDYVQRTSTRATLTPQFNARAAWHALNEGLGLAYVHTHPGSAPPQFSNVDDDGEEHLAEFARRRGLRGVQLSLVLSEGGICARVLGQREYVDVVEVGAKVRLLAERSRVSSVWSESRFDRQVRAFGKVLQARLAALKVGVVGLGGTGSIVVQQLAHLGVHNFMLIDPDTVEATNLNRLATARESDLGKFKVAVARRHVRGIVRNAHVRAIVADVVHAKTAQRLTEVDFIFACTDSHGSRSVIQQIAYQYLIPCIDMGSTIIVRDDRITHVQARVQLLAAGLPCLHCSGLLDPTEVRRDLMTEFERKSDPYIIGMREPAPAVMSLNGTIASLAVTMFLSVIGEFPSDSRYLLYNGLNSTLRSVAVPRDPRCFICSPEGALAQGDSMPLMARRN